MALSHKLAPSHLNVTTLNASSLNDFEFYKVIQRSHRYTRTTIMTSEANRLKSFAAKDEYCNGWNVNNPVSVLDLAATGLYWTGEDDRCVCAYCEGYLGNWEQGDDPAMIHKSMYPSCSFVLKKANNNIPIVGELVVRDDGAILVKPKETSGELVTEPRIPRYKNYDDRLASFENSNWPEDIASPETLAAAGFFKQNHDGDKVTCFHCDGSLENWETGDDPLVEHATWFPGCGFLSSLIGHDKIREYFNLAVAKNRQHERIQTELAYNSENRDFLRTYEPYVPTKRGLDVTGTGRDLKAPVSRDAQVCVGCDSTKPTVKAVPCDHYFYCFTCLVTNPLKTLCPICKQPIQSVNAVFEVTDQVDFDKPPKSIPRSPVSY